MKKILIAIIMLAASTQANAKSVEACKVYTALSVTVFDLRLNGVPEHAIYKEMEKVEGHGMRNMAIIATANAFKADVETPMEDFAKRTFKRCRAGDL